MEISKDTGAGNFQIEAYQDAVVTINGQQYNCPILITEDKILPLTLSSIENLTEDDFEKLLGCFLPNKPQVFLLGSGQTLFFPKAKVLAPLINHQIGIEVMDSKAACRTYTLLSSEGRSVIALLL